MTLLSLLKSPVTWVAAAAFAAVLAIGITYHKGETAGAAYVTTVVEHTTNDAIESARKDKEKADEKVRSTAPDAVIDATR